MSPESRRLCCCAVCNRPSCSAAPGLMLWNFRHRPAGASCYGADSVDERTEEGVRWIRVKGNSLHFIIARKRNGAVKICSTNSGIGVYESLSGKNLVEVLRKQKPSALGMKSLPRWTAENEAKDKLVRMIREIKLYCTIKSVKGESSCARAIASFSHFPFIF